MTEQLQVQRLLEENIPKRDLELPQQEFIAMSKLIASQLLTIKPETEDLIRSLITAMIVAYIRRMIPAMESSETEFWIKKLKEILNPPKSPAPPTPPPPKK